LLLSPSGTVVETQRDQREPNLSSTLTTSLQRNDGTNAVQTVKSSSIQNSES